MTPDQYVAAVRSLWRDEGVDIDEIWDTLPEAERNEAITRWGVGLPDWLRDLWATADGQGESPPLFTRPDYLTGLTFLSIDQAQGLQERLARIASNFVGWKEIPPRDTRIRPGWFPDSWVPFASFGGSIIVLFADMDPAPSGAVGQVIAYVHDPDQIAYVSEGGASFLEASLRWYRDSVDEFIDGSIDE